MWVGADLHAESANTKTWEVSLNLTSRKTLLGNTLEFRNKFHLVNLGARSETFDTLEDAVYAIAEQEMGAEVLSYVPVHLPKEAE
jgi:hypothetical protein